MYCGKGTSKNVFKSVLMYQQLCLINTDMQPSQKKIVLPKSKVIYTIGSLSTIKVYWTIQFYILGQ
jgi:hypothetical protein